MLQNIGPSQIIIILLVLVLLFGAKRIPELARSLGKSLTEFKKGREEGIDDNPEQSDTKKSESDN